MQSKLKILFVSRAYPPVIGGIENQNEAIGRWLSKSADCQIIANRGGKHWLPLFIPIAVIRSLILMRKQDVLLLGDGVVSIIGWFVRLLYPSKRIVCILHGLDVTYSSPIYQKFWVQLFFRAINHFIAVSQSTAELARQYASITDNITIIPNGVDILDEAITYSKKDLSDLLGIDVVERKVLLTVGRLVKRKGVVWFLRHVMRSLPEQFLYVVAGDGPERNEILSILEKPEYEGRVVFLGRISEGDKKLLFSTTDLFVQPNITVEGDAEGFGITIIEAGSYGLPVLASDIEGLRDSVTDGLNGWRVPAGDSNAFNTEIINKISAISEDPAIRSRVAEYIADTYSYEKIIVRYLTVLKEAS